MATTDKSKLKFQLLSLNQFSRRRKANEKQLANDPNGLRALQIVKGQRTFDEIGEKALDGFSNERHNESSKPPPSITSHVTALPFDSNLLTAVAPA